jgi:TonB-dependent starch-binding outer membrane protein SusC
MKKRSRRKAISFWLLMSVLLLSFTAYAQTINITGKIISTDDAQPMPGVNIKLKGTTIGTVSSIDGTYIIAAKPGDVLVFSYLGFTSQEITVKQAGSINVKLNSTSNHLNEVVVTGYATAKRADATGSISSIKGDDLRQTQPSTFDQALQGKVAGVVVQQVSGQPGGGVSIQIHGVSSITGANSPLYIIDGIVIPPVNDPGNGSNPLNTINPAEIETIDVLKDASATAIYGAQATNGVVVITTKRGKAGAPQVSYDFYAGYQELPNALPTMNLQQFATYIDTRAKVWGFDTRPEFVNAQYLGTGTDWQKELFRKAPQMSHSIRVSGGDDRTQYSLSGAYFDQQGIAIGSEFKRTSVRLNLDNKTTKWLKIGTSLQLAHVYENQNSTASAVIGNALNLTPDVPVKNPDGSWGGVTNTAGYITPVINPVAIAQLNKNVRSRNQVFGNAYAEIQITKNLTFRNEVSGNFDFSNQDYFAPTYAFGRAVKGTNDGSSYMYQNFYTVLRNYLTYSRYYSKFNFKVLAGHEAQSSSFENVGSSRSNFPSNNVQAISAGDAISAKNSGDNGLGNSSEAIFGRVDLNFYDKYLITGNIRDDGSSNFPTNNQWGVTYSGAFAWKINHESFLKNVNNINELTLRLGYGLTNNQNIPGNTFATQLTTVTNGLSGIAQYQSNLANPFVTWEKTGDFNASLDGTFFNGRFGFSFGVYDREVNGLLLRVPLPAYSATTTGYSPGAMQAPYANVGSMSNKGFDIRISTTNVSSKTFTWKTDITVSRNVNTVLSLGAGGAEANLSQTAYVGNSQIVVEKTMVGQPIGEFYGYIFDGIFSKPSDFTTHALPVDQNGKVYPISSSGGGIWYGDRMFKDLNGDGVIDSKDQTFLGSPLPKFQGGINNNFTFKNFDLNIFFSGNYGNKVFNQVAVTQTNSQNNTNYFAAVLNYARVALVDPAGSASDVNNVYVTNPNTTIAGLRQDNTNDNNRSSTLFLEDGSFLKCKNITLGYKLPQSILSKIHVNAFRIYGTVTNVFTITKYTGMDPEIGSWNPLQAGWDNGYYPQPRVFTIGANISFN